MIEMVDRTYQNGNKIYLKVAAVFHPDGQLYPTAFWWEDGRRFEIDRVIDVCRAASLKAGGVGVRYTCMVKGRQVFLFYEGERWFMERKE
jgi:hypothetical protein